MIEITVDFETYYDKQVSLTKLSTTEYLFHPEFKVHGCGVHDGRNGAYHWYRPEELAEFLDELRDKEVALICHNTMFDGAILAFHFNYVPDFYYDTMSMARADNPHESASLKSTGARYCGLEKGDELASILGVRDLDPEQELAISGYCLKDTQIARALFDHLKPKITESELQIIDLTIRMYTEPSFDLDLDILNQIGQDEKLKKSRLCEECGVDAATLRSNPKFAAELEKRGIIPPMKISPTTGKPTFAFSKKDPGWINMLKANPEQRLLFEAREANKSTQEETRAKRFAAACTPSGKLPIPLKYYGAHTGRFSGLDKLNPQNLGRESRLRHALKSPPGYQMLISDSAQIEARVLAWLAGQVDLLEQFAKDEDVYSRFAEKIYQMPINKKEYPTERFVGKTAVLGLGYGCGGKKFKDMLFSSEKAIDLPLEQCLEIVNLYRAANSAVVQLWNTMNSLLFVMANPNGQTEYEIPSEPGQYIRIHGERVQLPGDTMPLVYPDIQVEFVPEYLERPPQIEYVGRKGPVYLYGGKFVENQVQAISRHVVMGQMLRIHRDITENDLDARIVLTVHDEVVLIANNQHVDAVASIVTDSMGTPLDWCRNLPVSYELTVTDHYTK